MQDEIPNKRRNRRRMEIAMHIRPSSGRERRRCLVECLGQIPDVVPLLLRLVLVLVLVLRHPLVTWGSWLHRHWWGDLQLPRRREMTFADGTLGIDGI
jgi:hypothetical protein